MLQYRKIAKLGGKCETVTRIEKTGLQIVTYPNTSFQNGTTMVCSPTLPALAEKKSATAVAPPPAHVMAKGKDDKKRKNGAV